jgi:hypothetical protein
MVKKQVAVLVCDDLQQLMRPLVERPVVVEAALSRNKFSSASLEKVSLVGRDEFNLMLGPKFLSKAVQK